MLSSPERNLLPRWQEGLLQLPPLGNEAGWEFLVERMAARLQPARPPAGDRRGQRGAEQGPLPQGPSNHDPSRREETPDGSSGGDGLAVHDRKAEIPNDTYALLFY